MKKKLIIVFVTLALLYSVTILYLYIDGLIVMAYPDTYAEVTEIGELKMFVICKDIESKDGKVMNESVVVDNYTCKFRTSMELDDSCKIVYKREIDSCLNYSLKGAVKFEKIGLEDLRESYLFDCEYIDN